MTISNKYIRNYCILGHIDHGKSTLSDRLLEFTDTLSQREMKEQVLDQMDLERERGITIKATVVRLEYQAKDGNHYELNLIDTPGHVDFSYEVSRSLSACEGAVLIIDAAQGVEAQTLANAYLAVDQDLEIVPVINKIDLPHANPERVKQQVEDVIGIPADHALPVSAKEGIGIQEVLEAIVDQVPPPAGKSSDPLKALVIDSFYNSYRGVVLYIRIFEGQIKKGDRVYLMATDRSYEVEEVGVFRPEMGAVDELSAGSVGYLTASIKEISHAKIGDTLTHHDRRTSDALPGYRDTKPVVFCGLYPADTNDFTSLRDALEKLKLNDASFNFEPESSIALGYGFRCGFLGLLHMEVIQERLEREFDLILIRTSPSVQYNVYQTDGSKKIVDNPAFLPTADLIDYIQEPYIEAEIIVPSDFVGNIMDLCQKRRGTYIGMTNLDTTRIQLTYQLPLCEILIDFYDKLKSLSRGYASLEYEIGEYQTSNLVKLDILINEKPVDALSTILHRDMAYDRGRALCKKLKEIIPKQMFTVPIQAAIGNKIVSRETVRAFRKNVTAKCYGGDITRKRKLLEKQKEGKKRMKQVGSVEVPQEAFMAILSIKDDD
ncbi:elongation factor 4 [Candidatus Poribacteria bacterium]|nr:elongation factor 4 [Candidatus Poribacteria bacterium]